jgi:hypothetical protein
MKIVTAHQPAYLPWLGFFHKIALGDTAVILDDVQFEKNSFTNRNRIKGPNGAFWLTVPVGLKGHMGKTIREIGIDNSSLWAQKHLKAIEMNYGKAPYYRKYASFFRECYSMRWERLVDVNDFMLRWFLDQLNIRTQISKMSDLNLRGRKADLIADICSVSHADAFVFGACGRDYADIGRFDKRDVGFYFQDYRSPEYQQLHGAFVSNLSVVDLLFNHGPDSYDVLMRGNIQKEELCRHLSSAGASHEQ